MPSYSRVVPHCSYLVTLAFVPCYFHSCALLLSFLHPIVCALLLSFSLMLPCFCYFIVHTWLLMCCCSCLVAHTLLFCLVSWWPFCLAIIIVPSHLVGWWALLPCHCALMFYLASCWLFVVIFYLFQAPLGLPPFLLHYLVAHCCTLLFCLIHWYSLPTFLCRWRSLEQHQQNSSTNNIYIILFFVCLFCILFVIFFSWIHFVLV